jgi:hypothetical protein
VTRLLTLGSIAKREKSRTLESMKRKKVAVYWHADCRSGGVCVVDLGQLQHQFHE